MSSIIRNMARKQVASQVPNIPLGGGEAPLAQGYTNGHIVEMLRISDQRPEQSRVRAGYIHATSLPDMCPRKFQIANLIDHVSHERVTGGHRVIWAIGRALEKHVRDGYVRATDGAGVWGKWVCDCGNYRVDGTFPVGHGRCSHCRVKPYRYQEYTIVDDVHGVMGNPDFILLESGRMMVVEIKSIKAKGERDSFESLRSAHPDHIAQAAIYRKMLIDEGYNVSPYVVIFYVSKDFKYGQPYKEYKVEITDGLDAAIQGVFVQAKRVKDTPDEITLPRVCRSVGDTKAKNCPVATQCFNQRDV